MEPKVARRSWSHKSITSEGPPLHAQSKPWATTGDLTSRVDLNGNRIKKVKFSTRVHVVQIPTIEVYERQGIADLIWWKECEYDSFKQEAVNELRSFMCSSKISDSKLAISKLYINEVPEELSSVSFIRPQSDNHPTADLPSNQNCQDKKDNNLNSSLSPITSSLPSLPSPLKSCMKVTTKKISPLPSISSALLGNKLDVDLLENHHGHHVHRYHSLIDGDVYPIRSDFYNSSAGYSHFAELGARQAVMTQLCS